MHQIGLELSNGSIQSAHAAHAVKNIDCSSKLATEADNMIIVSLENFDLYAAPREKFPFRFNDCIFATLLLISVVDQQYSHR